MSLLEFPKDKKIYKIDFNKVNTIEDIKALLELKFRGRIFDEESLDSFPDIRHLLKYHTTHKPTPKRRSK